MIHATISLSFVLLAAPALAGDPDQVNDGPLAGGTSIGVIGSSFSQSAAQAITVGFDGWLSRVDMYVTASGGLSSPLVLEIQDVWDGAPDEYVFTRRELTPSPVGPQWISFDFSAFNVTVHAGQQIALVLRSGQDLTLGQYEAEGTHDLYAGGGAFSSESFGQWTPGNDFDLMFRTYVFPFDLGRCCNGDFNQDGEYIDDDIEAFFACLAGDCCGTCPPNADFNCDGDVGTDADIASFFAVLAGGSC